MRAESLFDTFEIVGLWWVPSHPDKKVHGTVTYRNGQSLELRMGGDFGIPDQPEPYELDVLQGDTLLHGQCTLIHLSLRTTRASSVAKELIYSAEQLIIGCHFDTPEKAGFKTSLFRFSLLEEWLDHEVFSYSYSDTGSEINVVGSVPPSISFKIQSLEADLKIVHLLKRKYSPKLNKMEMECASYIDILADKWRPLEWHIDVGRELQGFFTLLIGVPVLATQMQGVNEARQDEVPIGVFPLHGSSPPVELNRRFPIVTRELVLDDLDVMLERWFEQKEKLGPTRNLLFTVLRDPDILIENQLLMITQALERYHRVVNPGVYVDKDEYKNVYEKLVSAIPSDVAEPLRESLKSRIKFGNELSLRNRLSKLIQSLPEDFRKGLFRKEKEFIGRVVDMRNYLTHYPIGQEGQAPARMSFYEQTDAVQRLVVVLICLLLAELGLPDEKLRWIVRNILTHPRYSYLKVSG